MTSTEVPDRNSSGDITAEKQELSSNSSDTFSGNTNDDSDRTEPEQMETFDQIDSEENMIVVCSLCGCQIYQEPATTMPFSATADGAAVIDRRSENHGDEHDSPASAPEDEDGLRSP